LTRDFRAAYHKNALGESHPFWRLTTALSAFPVLSLWKSGGRVYQIFPGVIDVIEIHPIGAVSRCS